MGLSPSTCEIGENMSYAKTRTPHAIRLVSSDLNGTLVHRHTMSDMIRIAFPDDPERYIKAKAAFDKQTSGLMSMAGAFEVAGPLTKGLSLRIAIDYAMVKMRYVRGFAEFVSALSDRKILFMINSTGYGVTIETMKAVHGAEKFYGAVCNRLVFGWHGNPSETIDDAQIAGMVREYATGNTADDAYDRILATGQIELGIKDERDKARLAFEMAGKAGISKHEIVHMGDTMGDSGGIYGVAKNGGIGIAFNYNSALGQYLDEKMCNEAISGEIFLIDRKNENAHLANALEILFRT